MKRRFLHDRKAQARAERLSRTTRTLEERVTSSPFPDLAPLATFVLALAGAWAFLAQFALALPLQEEAQDTALRDTGCSVVLLLLALVLHTRGPSAVPAVLGLLVGLFLVVYGVAASHTTSRGAVNEVVTGAVVVLAAAVVLAGATTRPRASSRGGDDR